MRFNGNEERVGNFVEKVAMEYELGRMSFYPNGNYLGALNEIKDKRAIAETSSNKSVLILTVILLVFNMLNIIWGEYLKEISMLRLIGARKKDIRFMVIYQSLLLAVIGTAIGVIVGIGITGIGVNILKKKDWYFGNSKGETKIHIDSTVITKTTIISIYIYSISYNSSSYKNRKSRMYGKYIKFFKTKKQS